MINSREKGIRGELEWRDWLRKHLGIKARRGQQYAGNPDAPDVVSDIDGIHFEVKRVQRESPRAWMKKAISDAGPNIVPVVAFRPNREEWLVCIRAEDMEAFARAIIERDSDA